MLPELSIHEYLTRLAGPTAAPGGGAAAGLSGAQGAALLCMVCNLTIGRKKYAAVEADMIGHLAVAERLRGQLTELIDRDAGAYDGVMDAYKLPKDTDEQRAARSAAIQAGLKHATLIPLETLTACVEVLELTPAVLEKGNPNVVSDGGAGVLSAYAGMMTAAINVRINLNALKDEAFVAMIEGQMADLLARGEAARENGWATAAKRLGM